MKLNSKQYTKDHILLFGGGYGNLQAAERVIQIAEQMNMTTDQLICTGNMIGQFAQSDESIQFLKKNGIQTLAGANEINFKKGKTIRDNYTGFKINDPEISDSTQEWIAKLPKELTFEKDQKKFTIFHGGDDMASEIIFASTPAVRKLDFFAQTGSDIIISNHCGLPFKHWINNEGKLKLWISPGIIGMPANDGTCRSWFTVLDTKNIQVEFHAFCYDHTKTCDLIKESVRAKPYANSLKTGIWENCNLPESESQQQGIPIKADFVW